jgi:hypothetical protein
MLRELKFVMGAVSKKDMVPAMKHFAIQNGRVRSYNGTLALSSPIPFNIDCYPRADMLIKAIAMCDETVTLAMTPAGKLSVKSGAFKALISCVEASDVHLEPTGAELACDGEVLLKAFQVLEPMIGEDASRPWANGVLLRGESAFATCNVVLCEYWMGTAFPHVVNIPAAAVREVIRIGEPPASLMLDENSISFLYEDGRWIRTQLFSTEWPDLSKVLDRACNATEVDSRIFLAMQQLKPFVDKSSRVIFKPGIVSTHEAEEEGGHVELDGSVMQGIYSLEMLLLLKGVAKHADFTTYPKPCLFYGDRLRGAIVGRHM